MGFDDDLNVEGGRRGQKQGLCSMLLLTSKQASDVDKRPIKEEQILVEAIIEEWFEAKLIVIRVQTYRTRYVQNIQLAKYVRTP